MFTVTTLRARVVRRTGNAVAAGRGSLELAFGALGKGSPEGFGFPSVAAAVIEAPMFKGFKGEAGRNTVVSFASLYGSFPIGEATASVEEEFAINGFAGRTGDPRTLLFNWPPFADDPGEPTVFRGLMLARLKRIGNVPS